MIMEINTVCDKKFIKLHELSLDGGRKYVVASRKCAEKLARETDAVTCFVIMNGKLLLQYEYRFPARDFLLSPPAGLIDEEDRGCDDMLIRTAIREINEETGAVVTEKDRVFVVNECVFSSPGMTDESNALVCAVIDDFDVSALNNSGAVGGETFDGFVLADEEKARELIARGKDDNGKYFPVYTYAALLYYLSGAWKD